MSAAKSFVGFITTLAFAKAVKLDDDSLYHVVEDLPGNETQESGEENVASSLDVVAGHGQTKNIYELIGLILIIICY